MSQLFNKVKVANTSRSTFDLSHHQVTSSDFGYLIPICYRDMLPNDDFTVDPEVFVRLAPMASPTYGKIKCSVHHFFVPYRILYPKWNAFITQDASNHTIPPYIAVDTLKTLLLKDPKVNPGVLPADAVPPGLFLRLCSNLGLNPNFINADSAAYIERFAAFPFLAYYRIWLDYFMDSNINSHSSMVESFNQNIANGGALSYQFCEQILQTRNRCFKKDYFTSAKLSPQAGDAARVSVPLASRDLNPALYADSGSNTGIQKVGNTDKLSINGQYSSSTGIVGMFTAEAMRFAQSLQRWSERSNYVGSKLINQLLVHFGVEPTPERLDMAEFLGGDSFNVQIGDVTSTSQQSSSSTGGLDSFGLGAQAGKGVGAGKPGQIHYHATEHGIFMSLLSILPDTGYYQGISRFWTKGVTGDAFDYFTPEFENLGFQEVLNHELFVPTDPDSYTEYDSYGIFGYQPRYSEYKFQNDVLGGDFVSPLADDVLATGSFLDSFHLFRKLVYDDESPLALNSNFVECDNMKNDYDRVFQVATNEFDHFFFNVYMDVKATRDMVGFAEPSVDSVNNLGDGRLINIPYGGTRL